MLGLLNKLINPIMMFVLQSRFHSLFSKDLMLLTFTGRKSGLRFTTPVMYVRNGDRVIVAVAEHESKIWWRNYRKPGGVAMLIAGERLTGRAEAVTDADPQRLDLLFREISLTHNKLARFAGYQPGAPEGCVAVEIRCDYSPMEAAVQRARH